VEESVRKIERSGKREEEEEGRAILTDLLLSLVYYTVMI
jgi:hypothetical protein